MLVERERQVPSLSKTTSCTSWPAAFLTTTVSGFGRTSTLKAPTFLCIGRVMVTHAQGGRRIRAVRPARG